jgi:hypothetical protein
MEECITTLNDGRREEKMEHGDVRLELKFHRAVLSSTLAVFFQSQSIVGFGVFSNAIELNRLYLVS